MIRFNAADASARVDLLMLRFRFGRWDSLRCRSACEGRTGPTVVAMVGSL